MKTSPLTKLLLVIVLCLDPVNAKDAAPSFTGGEDYSRYCSEMAFAAPLGSMLRPFNDVRVSWVSLIPVVKPSRWEFWAAYTSSFLSNRSETVDMIYDRVADLPPPQRIVAFAEQIFNSSSLRAELMRAGIQDGVVRDPEGVADPLYLRLARDFSDRLESGRLDASEQAVKRLALVVYEEWVFQHLMYLSLRCWDNGMEESPARFKQLEALLIDLQEGPSSSGHFFVRDAAFLPFLATAPPVVNPSAGVAYANFSQRLFKHPDVLQQVRMKVVETVVNVAHLSQQLTREKFESPDVLASAIFSANAAPDIMILSRNFPYLISMATRPEVVLGDSLKNRVDEAIFSIVQLDPQFFVFVENVGIHLRFAENEIRDFIIDSLLQVDPFQSQPLIRRLFQAWDPRGFPYSPGGLRSFLSIDLLEAVLLAAAETPSAAGVSVDDAFFSSHDPLLTEMSQKWQGVSPFRGVHQTPESVFYIFDQAIKRFEKALDSFPMLRSMRHLHPVPLRTHSLEMTA